MFGSVQTEDDQQVFRNKARHLAGHRPTPDYLSSGARQKIFDWQVYGIEVRLQGPLQFKQVLSGVAVERTLVSNSQPQAFDGWMQAGGGTVSNFCQQLCRAIEIRRRNQKIEIGITAQAGIAVKRLRQRGAFERDGSQPVRLEVARDTQHFGGKPKTALQV